MYILYIAYPLVRSPAPTPRLSFRMNSSALFGSSFLYSAPSPSLFSSTIFALPFSPLCLVPPSSRSLLTPIIFMPIINSIFL
ncbi:hypothetical protein GYMLUDRAFT_913213 [Collybiopsis luxurians FD-317 M1]|nr:hypothetical protein GYMLUDRAFT_913213 [Collybiopsis luxurians FD-317 M1]